MQVLAYFLTKNELTAREGIKVGDWVRVGLRPKICRGGGDGSDHGAALGRIKMNQADTCASLIKQSEKAK